MNTQIKLPKTEGYFFCYDVKLCNYLNKKGFRYITKARTLSCTRIFCLYEQSEGLRKAIDEFKLMQQSQL